MPTFKMIMAVDVESHVCVNGACGEEFSVLMVIKPTEEYLAEEPLAETQWTDWASDAEQKPFCPHCGVQVK